MAPMTYEDRARAARTVSATFPLRVATAAVKHAKWQVANGNDDALIALGWSVINNPEAYSARMALSALVEPQLDSIEAVDEVSDSTLQSIIETIFPLFVAPVAN